MCTCTSKIAVQLTGSRYEGGKNPQKSSTDEEASMGSVWPHRQFRNVTVEDEKTERKKNRAWRGRETGI